jgi:hypothetical protein
MDRSLALRSQFRHLRLHLRPVLALLFLELVLAFQLSFFPHDEQPLSCAQHVSWLKYLKKKITLKYSNELFCCCS